MWQRAVWQRVAVIASVAWLGGVLIYSATSRSFAWFGYSGDLGPAAITAFVGTIVIVVVCLGVPWIGKAAGKPTGPTPRQWFPKPTYHLTLTTPQGKRLIPFDDVLRFSRHSRKGDITIATVHLTTGEAVTGEAMEGVLQLLTKSLAESEPIPPAARSPS
jgi:hypothetical protein